MLWTCLTLSLACGLADDPATLVPGRGEIGRAWRRLEAALDQGAPPEPTAGRRSTL